jgi:hypothetical protein
VVEAGKMTTVDLNLVERFEILHKTSAGSKPINCVIYFIAQFCVHGALLFWKLKFSVTVAIILTCLGKILS